MEQSIFIKWVQKYFPGLVLSVVQTLNDAKRQSLPYMHTLMLRREFSVTGKWETISSNHNIVAADVVAMDSPLPLKKRDTMAKASGDVPKMGMEFKLNERQITDLNTLIATGGREAQIVAKLFSDIPRAIGGVYERNEAMFLEGLSTGVTAVPDSDNVGTAIRLDFGYKNENKFGVAVVWSNAASATPYDDFVKVVEKARDDGNVITEVLMDRFAFTNLAKTDQIKQLFAFSMGFTGSNIPLPTFDQVNQTIRSHFNFGIRLVERTVKVQKNGQNTNITPWAQGAVVFICSPVIGSLTWARLAEDTNRVAGVEYQNADEYILISKYRVNKPSLAEVTQSQARAFPVIGDVDSIYLLDSKTVQA